MIKRDTNLCDATVPSIHLLPPFYAARIEHLLRGTVLRLNVLLLLNVLLVHVLRITYAPLPKTFLFTRPAPLHFVCNGSFSISFLILLTESVGSSNNPYIDFAAQPEPNPTGV